MGNQAERYESGDIFDGQEVDGRNIRYTPERYATRQPAGRRYK